MSATKGWIGVDLDGTLARYDGWRGVAHIGEPVPEMLHRVLGWINEGRDVRIFTARVGDHVVDPEGLQLVQTTIEQWCHKHLGKVLPITNKKDFAMIELWDDRAVQVEPNTGRRVDGKTP